MESWFVLKLMEIFVISFRHKRKGRSSIKKLHNFTLPHLVQAKSEQSARILHEIWAKSKLVLAKVIPSKIFEQSLS